MPGFATLGIVAADFDGDDFLDLLFPNYHSQLTRESTPCYLYWGGPNSFSPQRRTILINDSASEGFAADFDKDGLIDLAVNNHTRRGNHNTFSKVFYNDGRRFDNPRIEKLPTHGPHWSWCQDMGHIYNRKWQQTYESSVFKLTRKAKSGRLSYDAAVPDGTILNFETRAAGRERELNQNPWCHVDSGSFSLTKKDRYIQYRAIFISDNGDRFPVLDRVTIEVK